MLDVNELQEEFKGVLELDASLEPGYSYLTCTLVKWNFGLRLDDEEQDVKGILKDYWIAKLQEKIQKLEAIE